MSPVLLAALERLAAARIEIIPTPGLTRHVVLARDGFASLVERTATGFGGIGAAGRVDSRGFAALVWRDGGPVFVSKQGEQTATPEEVETLRKFSADLAAALDASEPRNSSV
jgi:hypothetical protein